MFKNLNYLCKLLFTTLIVIAIAVTNNIYINVSLIILLFFCILFNKDYFLMILVIISILLYRFGILDLRFVWVQKIFLIFSYIILLSTSLDKSEKRYFKEQLFYRKRNKKKLYNQIYFKDKYRENIDDNFSFKKRRIARAKTLNDINELKIVNMLKYYGIHKKRTKYKYDHWDVNNIAIVLISATIFILSIRFR